MSLNDGIEEELAIMNERVKSSEKTITAEVFENPIRDLLSPKVKCVDVSCTIGEAITIMQENKIGSVVITKEGKLEGIFTERDVLMRVIGKVENYKETPITEVMTTDPISLQSEDMIAYVMNNMHVGGFRHVPVVDENDVPQSIVSIKDVLSYILDWFPESVLNITSGPYRGNSTGEG